MSHFGDGRLFLRQQGHVSCPLGYPRRPAPGLEKAARAHLCPLGYQGRGHLPTQGGDSDSGV